MDERGLCIRCLTTAWGGGSGGRKVFGLLASSKIPWTLFVHPRQRAMTASKLSEPDEQGFVTVQTIKYKTPSQNPAQKSKKNRKNRRPIPEESVSIRLANLAKRLDAHKLSLASGPWGQAWTGTGIPSLVSSLWFQADKPSHGICNLSLCPRSALPDDPSGPFQPSSPLKKAKSILCLGLGSLETSRIAQCQLALMLDLSDRLQVNPSKPSSDCSFPQLFNDCSPFVV